MAQPLGLRAPADVYPSAGTAFMSILCTNQTTHTHMQDCCIHSFMFHPACTAPPQQAQLVGILCTASLRLPIILFTFNDYLCHISTSKPGKMKANSKTYLDSEKSRPTFSGDLAWLRGWCSAFNTWSKLAFWAQVSLLTARSGRESKEKRSHPSPSPLPRTQELSGS